MHLIDTVLSNDYRASNLNKIMQLPRNLEGDSMNGFDRSVNVETLESLFSNPSS